MYIWRRIFWYKVYDDSLQSSSVLPVPSALCWLSSAYDRWYKTSKGNRSKIPRPAIHEAIALILIGSVAKGTERADSDLDGVVILSEEEYAEKEKNNTTTETINGLPPSLFKSISFNSNVTYYSMSLLYHRHTHNSIKFCSIFLYLILRRRICRKRKE